jgi:hypothetical protein
MASANGLNFAGERCPGAISSVLTRILPAALSRPANFLATPSVESGHDRPSVRAVWRAVRQYIDRADIILTYENDPAKVASFSSEDRGILRGSLRRDTKR